MTTWHDQITFTAMGSRSLAERARLYLRNDDIAETAISTDKSMIERATFTRADAIEEEVIAAAWVMDSMINLRWVEQRNTNSTLAHIVQQELGDCLYGYSYRCEATDTADNDLILELMNAQDRRHGFYVDMLGGILGTSYLQTCQTGPTGGMSTPSVDACIEEKPDFDRIEAAGFLRKQSVSGEIVVSKAVGDAAVALVRLRQTRRVSSDEVDDAVTALADRQEAYRAACGATDRADMVLIAEIRRSHRLRRDSMANRIILQHRQG